MNNPSPYIPDRGDLVWISFDPQAGREQAGHRPGLVLSRWQYNGPSGLALICPITSRVKGHTYEVLLPAGLAFTGVVLADHAKSQDWRARGAVFAGVAPPVVVAEVIRRLRTLLV